MKSHIRPPRPVLVRAFREVCLSLIGLYHLYDAEPALVDATAQTLADLFRDNLEREASSSSATVCGPLHALLDEIDAVAGELG